MSLLIEVADRQHAVAVDEARLRRAIEPILLDAGIVQARLSVALVDDPTIHELNRRYLAHDQPTDVLSFVLERRGSALEGEIVASGDTARRVAAELGWPAADELLLYVIHGALHLVGCDDADDAQRNQMRRRERHYLLRAGCAAPPEPS